jgi:hypothetical protein
MLWQTLNAFDCDSISLLNSLRKEKDTVSPTREGQWSKVVSIAVAA